MQHTLLRGVYALCYANCNLVRTPFVPVQLGAQDSSKWPNYYVLPARLAQVIQLAPASLLFV